MKVPNVSMEDIVNYAHIGGHTGKVGKVGPELSDDMHCYAQFLFFLETNLIGLNGENAVGFDKVKNMNRDERKGYFQASIDRLLDEIIRTCVNDKSIKNKKIEIPQNSLLATSSLSPYVINYMLRLNGYKIEGDYEATKELPSRASYSIIRSTPILEESIVKMNFKNLGESSPINFLEQFRHSISKPRSRK